MREARRVSAISDAGCSGCDAALPDDAQGAAEDDQIRDAMEGVYADVEAGSSLGRDGRHPNVSTASTGHVRSGEESGRLEDVLDRVAFRIEKLDALKRQVRRR